MVFCVDCDEVLRSTLDDMIRIYNRDIGDTMKRKDVKYFDVSKSFPRVEEETGINPKTWFFDLHGKELFLNSKPIKGVKKAIEILKKHGDVVIVTHQYGCENKMDTLNWLCKHDLMCDDVCFMKDKWRVHCDYLIDDNVDNFKGSYAKYGILITAPYNEDYTVYSEEFGVKTIVDNSLTKVMNSSPSFLNAMRFNSLLDFANYIEKKYRNENI